MSPFIPDFLLWAQEFHRLAMAWNDLLEHLGNERLIIRGPIGQSRIMWSRGVLHDEALITMNLGEET